MRDEKDLSGMETRTIRPMHRYRAFGLHIQSEILLPELREENAKTVAEVSIKVGDTDICTDDWRQMGACCRTKDGRLWLKVPGIATFLVSAQGIQVTSFESGDWETIRLYLLGNALGALLHLRGLLVLHGCTLAMGDSAFAICGHSGVGKSTLTAALVKKGCRLVADELCVINAEGRVFSGYAEIKLWRDALDALDIDSTGLRQLRARLNKYAWRDFSFQTAAPPLETVFCLSWIWEWQKVSGQIRDKALKTCVGVEKFQQLRTQVYRPAYVDGLDLNVPNFHLLSAVIARTSVMAIPRYKEKLSPDCLDRRADLVMDIVKHREDIPLMT